MLAMPTVHQTSAKIIALICKRVELPRMRRKLHASVGVLEWAMPERSHTKPAALHQCRPGRMSAQRSNSASVRAGRAARKHAYDSVLTPCCVRPRAHEACSPIRNLQHGNAIVREPVPEAASDPLQMDPLQMICRLARIIADRREA